MVTQTNEKIEKAESEAKKLQKEVVERFHDNEDFRKGIYDIILKSINERNKRCPEDLKPTPSVQELLDDEKKLYNEVTAELKSCALELKPNLTEEEYASTYDPGIIKYSFINDDGLYEAYLEAISSKSYFVFIEEIRVLASLANIEIDAHYKDNDHIVYEPNLRMVEGYQPNNELWGNKKKEVI